MPKCRESHGENQQCSSQSDVKKGDIEVLGDWLRLVFGEVAANIVDIIVCFQGAFLMFQIFGGGTWA